MKNLQNMFCAKLLVVFIFAAYAAFAQAEIVGNEDRLTNRGYKEKHQLSSAEMKARFGGIGRIECPWISGTVFLVQSQDIVITAGHIFRDEKGRARGQPSKCTIKFFYSKARYTIDPRRMTNGLDLNAAVTFDWVVLGLNSPVVDVRPYSLQIRPTKEDKIEEELLVVSAGHEGWKRHPNNEPSFGECIELGKLTEVKETAVMHTDCDGGGGSSGSPVFARKAESFSYSVIALLHGKFEFDEPYRFNKQLWKVTSRAIMVSSPLAAAVVSLAAKAGQ